MIVVKINKLEYLRLLPVVEYALGIEVTRILQTREDKIRIPKRPCNVLFIL